MKRELQNNWKGLESIPTYFHKSKVIAHQLALASKCVDEEDLMSYILVALMPQEYGSLHTATNTQVNPMTLEDLFAMFLCHEA